MQDTGGARKVRHAKDGSGKSGGFRTIHYFEGGNIPIFLLSIFDKHEKTNLSMAERNALRKLLIALADEYSKPKQKGH